MNMMICALDSEYDEYAYLFWMNMMIYALLNEVYDDL